MYHPIHDAFRYVCISFLNSLAFIPQLITYSVILHIKPFSQSYDLNSYLIFDTYMC